MTITINHKLGDTVAVIQGFGIKDLLRTIETIGTETSHHEINIWYILNGGGTYTAAEVLTLEELSNTYKQCKQILSDLTLSRFPMLEEHLIKLTQDADRLLTEYNQSVTPKDKIK